MRWADTAMRLYFIMKAVNIRMEQALEAGFLWSPICLFLL
ncbi:hypothetical protein DSUL_50181 [Desulfovibrionales bacterium]